MLHVGSSEVSAGDQMVYHQARIDMLQLEQSRLAAEFEAGDQWETEGFNSAYDFNGDGTADGGDFAEFGNRFGRTLP